MADQRLRRINFICGACVFLILLACYSYFFPKWGDWGAKSRADMVFAVVEQGTFRIDAYHTNTNDKAYYQGHYYSDKSFGPSLIALPGYLTFRALARIDTLETRIMDEDSRLAQFFVSDIIPNPGDRTNTAYEEMAIAAMAFWAAALPSALLGLLLYTFASGIMRQPLHAALLALTYGLATIAFPYSTVFYQHQLGALGMFGGFVALWRVIVEDARLRWLWGAGVMFGLAIICDYPTVPFLGMIGLWALLALWRDGRAWALWRTVVGALPFIILLGLYNWHVFGSPFDLGYAYSVTDVDIAGFFGIAGPTWWRLYGVTVSTFRGLFFISPVLLLAIPGWLLMWQRYPQRRGMVLVLIAVPVGFILYNASMVTWIAGASIGPRYLAPTLPLMMVPIAYAFDALLRPGRQYRLHRRVVALLIVLSALNVWAHTLGGQYFPFVSGSDNIAIMNPLVDHALPRLIDGDIQRNYGALIGLPGWLSLLPLIVMLALLGRWCFLRPQRERLSEPRPAAYNGQRTPH